MRIALDYIAFLIKSKNRHGVHSPFVFELNEKVLNTRNKIPLEDEIEELRRKFLNDISLVDEINFGASKHPNSNTKKTISRIAKNSLKPKRQASFIARLAKFNKSHAIIELGTSLGISTAYIAAANSDAEIYSIDASPTAIKKATEVLTQLDLKNLTLIFSDFDQALLQLEIPKNGFDFVYIDGNHTLKATLKYFEFFSTKLSEHGLILFDDIYWSTEMKQAWKSIKRDPRTSLTIDFFHFGLVSLSSRFSKENFSLRSNLFF